LQPRAISTTADCCVHPADYIVESATRRINHYTRRCSLIRTYVAYTGTSRGAVVDDRCAEGCAARRRSHTHTQLYRQTAVLLLLLPPLPLINNNVIRLPLVTAGRRSVSARCRYRRFPLVHRPNGPTTDLAAAADAADILLTTERHPETRRMHDRADRQPGFHLPRHAWSLMNRFRTGQDPCRANLHKWGLAPNHLPVIVAGVRP